MKKIFLGIFLGLVLGAGAMWLLGSGGGAPSAEPIKGADTTPADEPKPGAVKLDADAQEQAGIKTSQPVAAEYKPEAKGFARVLDPASLTADLAEITADTAMYSASANGYQRLQILKAGGNASGQAVEAAEAAMLHDGSQLDAAKARLIADWGPALAARVDLPQLAKTLLAQDAALVRVDILGGETLPAEPREIHVALVLGGADPVAVEVLGPAPSADPQAQGVSFLALLGQSPPAPGTQLLAWMTHAGEGEQGLSLLGTAVVRYDGDTFVYTQTSSDVFTRRRVELGATLRDGSVFVTNGVTAQDHIVVNGAQQILSEELKAATGGPD